MADFTIIDRGPWRIRTSGMGDEQAVIAHRADGKSEVVTVETHADLALLRDAINEYLDVAEANR